MGLFGPPNVEKLKARKNVKRLIKALGYKVKGLTKFISLQEDGDVRKAAARALGKIGDARAVEPLIAALSDKIWDVRIAAVEALGQIGDARAMEPLIAALKEDKNKDVRSAAAKALGQIGDASVVKPLIAALSYEENVRQAAADALDKLGWQPDQGGAGEAYYWVIRGQWDRCVQIGASAVVPLIFALKNKDEDVRSAAAEVLGRIGDARAVEPLIAELRYETSFANLRQAAATALGRIGDTRAVERLITKLNDKDKDMRQAAMAALVQIGDAHAVEALTVALNKDLFTRMAATEALVQIGMPSVDSLIVKLEDENKNVRQAAAEALGMIGDARAVEPLIVALEDRVTEVRQSAAEALDKLGWQPDQGAAGATYWIVQEQWSRCVQIGAPAVAPLLVALRNQENVRQAAVEALGQIGTPSVEPLIGTLGDSNEYMRKTSATILEKLGWQPDQGEAGAAYWVIHRQWERCVQIGAPAVESLIVALQDPDENVRTAVTGALGQIRDTRAVNPLIGALQDLHLPTREAAAKALGQIGDARAVKPLIGALESGNPDVLQAAIKALGQIGDAHAVKPLIPLLQSSITTTRMWAAEALVALYQSGRLDENHQRLILAQRSTITSKRVDEKTHYDIDRPGAPTDCHVDDRGHLDTGIGVNFPV